MRARTLTAGTTLAIMIAVWGAPAALAEDNEPDDHVAPPMSSAPAEPAPPNVQRLQPDSEAPEPDADEQRKQQEQQQKAAEQAAAKKAVDEAAAKKASDEAAKAQQALPEADLSAPDRLFPGDVFTVRAECRNSAPAAPTFTGPATSENGSFKVDDDAKTDDRIVFSLVCGNAPNQASANATVRVKEKRGDGGYDGKAWLDLDPSSGERGDEVDVRAYCPGTGDARLESDVLRASTLKRRGDRLFGETKVEDDADYGRDHAVLICDNGDRDRERFFVRRDDDISELLDLDPSHGKRSDDIDVYVQCNDSDHVGRLESDVLEDIDLDRDGRYYHGTTEVEDGAGRGEHPVKIRCGDDWLEEEFFVHGDDEDSDGGEQVVVYPKGAPQTGGGSGDGAPFAAMALGLTGVLGAGLAGAGAIAERRAARR